MQDYTGTEAANVVGLQTIEDMIKEFREGQQRQINEFVGNLMAANDEFEKKLRRFTAFRNRRSEVVNRANE